MAITVPGHSSDSSGWDGTITGVQAGEDVIFLGYGEIEGESPTITSITLNSEAPDGTQVITPGGTEVGNFFFYVAWWINPGAGDHTLSASASGTGTRDSALYRTTGLDLSAGITDFNSAEESSVTTCATGSVTTTVADGLLVMQGCEVSGGGAETINPNFTETFNTSTELAGYRILDSAGTYNGDWTNSQPCDHQSVIVAFQAEAEVDETAPTVESASINEDGDELTVEFSEAVTVGVDAWSGFSLGGVSGETLTYSSGDESDTVVFAISGVTILQSDTVTLDYTQPGDGVQDAAENLLATFSGESVTNNSTVEPVLAGIQSATLMQPNADSPVANASNVTVRIWHGDAISGAPDELLSNQSITSGVLEFEVQASVDDPISYQARWTVTVGEDTEDRFFEVLNQAAIDLNA